MNSASDLHRVLPVSMYGIPVVRSDLLFPMQGMAHGATIKSLSPEPVKK
jgi:hypothetical protein